MHGFDPLTSIEETLRALDDLVRSGKVRYIGCSNFAGWQLMKSLSISERYGWAKFVSIQVFYSLVSRTIEYDLVPLWLDQGLSILTWYALAGGFLTGKYRRGKPLPKGTRLTDKPAEAPPIPYDEDRGFDIIDELDKIAKEHNATVPQAALNYLLQKPGVASVIVGARKPEQLADNLKATEWELTPAEFSRLDELSQPDPVYPYWYEQWNILGREGDPRWPTFKKSWSLANWGVPISYGNKIFSIRKIQVYLN